MKLNRKAKRRDCLTFRVSAAATSMLALRRFSSRMDCIIFSFVSNKPCTEHKCTLVHILHDARKLKYNSEYIHNWSDGVQNIPSTSPPLQNCLSLVILAYQSLPAFQAPWHVLLHLIVPKKEEISNSSLRDETQFRSSQTTQKFEVPVVFTWA